MPGNKPIMNDDNIGGGDPSMLVTGSSSKMFANERIADKNKHKRAIVARRANQPKGSRGIVLEIQDVIDAARRDNDSIGSYLRTMFAQGSSSDSMKEQAAKIAVEFRAREMNLQLIERIQKCLDKHKNPAMM